MAHELATIAQGVLSMAQLVDAPLPWWSNVNLMPGLVPHGASVEEWRTAAGLTWDALSLPAQYTMPDGSMMTDQDTRIIVRSDTGAVLGTGSKQYKVHSVAEVMETFEKLCATSFGGGWRICTIGAIREGRVIWAQAERDEAAEIVPGDIVQNRILLQTSFDGTQRTGAAETDVRVVCANTRRQAWNNSTNKVTLSHRSKFDGADLLKRLGVHSESFARSIEACRKLADKAMSDGQARDMLRQLFGQKPTAKPAEVETAPIASDVIPGIESVDFAALLSRPIGGHNSVKPVKPAKSENADPKDHRNIGRIMDLFHGAGQGASMAGVHGTAWGLLNSVTEFVDHHAGRSIDTRMQSAFFGQGDTLKQKAFNILTADDAVIVG